jgi:hypothetical protein
VVFRRAIRLRIRPRLNRLAQSSVPGAVETCLSQEGQGISRRLGEFVATLTLVITILGGIRYAPRAVPVVGGAHHHRWVLVYVRYFIRQSCGNARAGSQRRSRASQLTTFRRSSLLSCSLPVQGRWPHQLCLGVSGRASPHLGPRMRRAANRAATAQAKVVPLVRAGRHPWCCAPTR